MSERVFGNDHPNTITEYVRTIITFNWEFIFALIATFNCGFVRNLITSVSDLSCNCIYHLSMWFVSLIFVTHK